MSNQEQIQSEIKTFIFTELLPGEDASELLPDTELIKTGILDSVSALRLVAFLEERFEFAIEAHEATVDTFRSITTIAALVTSKLS